MIYNPRTKVTEYWVYVDPATLPQGLFEVRAIAFPNAGIPRVLQGPIKITNPELSFKNGNHSMFLFADPANNYTKPEAWCSPNGNDSTAMIGVKSFPFKNINVALATIAQNTPTQANNAYVYLERGDYILDNMNGLGSVPMNEDIWGTIQPAKGVDKSEVRITKTSSVGGAGDKIILLKLRNLTIQKLEPFVKNDIQFKGKFLWFDNCDYIGLRTEHYAIVGLTWAKTYYVTDCYITECRNTMRDAQFMRNLRFGLISGVMIGSEACFSVNLVCEDGYSNKGTGPPKHSSPFHGDVIHWFPQHNDAENYIAYGIRAYKWATQAIYGELMPPKKYSGQIISNTKLDNVAIVNFHTTQDKVNNEGDVISDQSVWDYLDGDFIGTGLQHWWTRETNHLLLWHITSPGSRFLFDFVPTKKAPDWLVRMEGNGHLPIRNFLPDGTVPPISIKNVSIKGGIFVKFGKHDPLDPQYGNKNVVIENMHYTNPGVGGSLGTLPGVVSTGNPEFKNPHEGFTDSDYHLEQSSPCKGKVPKITQADVENTVRNSFSDIGAWE